MALAPGGPIKALVKFTDQVRLEFQLLDPDNDCPGTNGCAPEHVIPREAVNGPGGNSPEENTIPRIDVSVNIKVANFVIEPAVTWLRQEFDQVAAGNDDSFDIFGLAVGAKAGFGPLTLSNAVHYGENLGIEVLANSHASLEF